MNFFVKQPSETFSIAIDFSAVLVEPETISTAVVSSIDKSTGQDTTALVIESSVIDEGNVNIKVKNGVDKEMHKITIKVTTSAANVYEADVVMAVREQ